MIYDCMTPLHTFSLPICTIVHLYNRYLILVKQWREWIGGSGGKNVFNWIKMSPPLGHYLFRCYCILRSLLIPYFSSYLIFCVYDYIIAPIIIIISRSVFTINIQNPARITSFSSAHIRDSYNICQTDENWIE